MARAAAEASSTGTSTDVEAVLRDRAGWSRWMPGVTDIELAGDLVRWQIQTPFGPAPVGLRFADRPDGTTFVMVDPGGPFTAMDGEVRVLAVPSGSRVIVSMTLEGEPPVPSPMVEGIVQQAAAALAAVAAWGGASSPAEPELLAVPMSDEVEIAVHHYRTATDRAPALLLSIPYRKEGAFVPQMAAMFTAAGYHFLVADVRGFGGSEASYEGLLNDREIADGVELVEWIAAQPFCDGGVGLYGASYCGCNQLLIAARKPPSLKCIAPVVGPVDTFRDWTHRGGIRSHTLWGAMTYLGSQHQSTADAGTAHYYGELLADPLDNDGHRHRSPEYRLADVEVPSLCIGGWHDYFLRATVRSYLGMGGPKRLLLGPWGHGLGPPLDELLPWYGHWLKGEGDDPTHGKRVRLYCTGAEEWRLHDDWPDPATTEWARWSPVTEPTELRVVTHPQAVMPATNFRPEFMPDPTDSGMSLWGEDVTFDTDPAPDAMVLEGPVALLAVLRVHGCEDVNVHARVSVVDSEGGVHQLTEGRLRASHRAVDPARTAYSAAGEPVVPWHPHDVHEPIPEGEPVELAVELYPVCHRVEAGQRLRLGLTLVRSDEGAVPATAVVEPTTRLLLPAVRP